LDDELNFRNIILSTQQEASIDGILVIDEKGTIISYNLNFIQIWGIPSEIIESRSDEAALKYVMNKMAEPEQFKEKVDYLYSHPDETSKDIIALKDGRSLDRYSAPMIGPDKKNYGRVWFFRDITDRIKIEENLALETKKYSALADLAGKLVSPASIADISDMVLDSAQKLTHSLYGFVGYIDSETGYMISTTMSRGIWETCQVADKSFVFKKFGGLWGWVLINRQSILTNTPGKDPRSTGTPPGHVPVKNFLSAPAMFDNELVGLIALANSQRNYDELDLSFVERLAAIYAIAINRKKTEDTMSRLAYHDTLTGLPNRILFYDHYKLAIAAARRYPQKIAFMILDIDYFKKINDSLGHDCGDQLLKEYAGRLASNMRKTDTVSRIGGDEFALLVPEVNETEYINTVARKLLTAIREPFIIHNHKITVTSSIGVAVYPDDGEDIETLLKKADIAMYQVKESGRNGFLRYKPDNTISGTQ
jgi:diguanylate cyclase (GGDEF)-like protein/PAS domain S-box-containing protein